MKRREDRRTHRSPEEIAQLLGEYHRSDLTRRAFADWKGLSLSSLSLWLRKARERDGRGAPVESPRLVPVRLRQAAGAGFELLIAGGAILRIPADFDEAALCGLLEILEVRCSA